MKGAALILALLFVFSSPQMASAADANDQPGSLVTELDSQGVTVDAGTIERSAGTGGSDPEPVKAASPKTPPVELRATLGCGSTSSPDVTVDITDCTLALKACATSADLYAQLLYLWTRPAQSNEPWRFQGQTCNRRQLPPNTVMPDPTPSIAQIQEAFRRLPFSKPRVRIEPKGNVTLVNLPTYYEATWPGDSGLEPGETSAPVQLLSWSVEFKIDSQSYNFHYGDGSSSGTVEDAGGGYPDGSVKHTYTKPIDAASVSVDSRLTGQFRVNGGDWVDIDTVADLQNEPVTTLQVREAKARLYTN